jgi:hypothetical protein
LPNGHTERAESQNQKEIEKGSSYGCFFIGIFSFFGTANAAPATEKVKGAKKHESNHL